MPIAEALRQRLLACGATLSAAAKDLRKQKAERPPLEVSELSGGVLNSSKGVAQAARALHFLLQGAPSAATAVPCVVDFEKAALAYHSWARGLLAAVGPAARKLSTRPCAEVLQVAAQLAVKAAAAELAPPDVGQLERSVAALDSLPLSSHAAAAVLLPQCSLLVADAATELARAVDEAAEGGGDFGEDDGDDDDDDDDDDDEPELVAQPALTAPLLALIRGAAAVLRCAERGLQAVAARDGSGGDDSKVAAALAAAADASSAQVDSLVCAVYEEARPAVGSYAASLGKLLAKVHQLLADKCGLADDAERAAAHAELEASLAGVAAWAAAAPPGTAAAAAEGVASLSIG